MSESCSTFSALSPILDVRTDIVDVRTAILAILDVRTAILDVTTANLDIKTGILDVETAILDMKTLKTAFLFTQIELCQIQELIPGFSCVTTVTSVFLLFSDITQDRHRK